MQALRVGKCARKKDNNKKESKKNGKAVVNNHETTIIAPHRNSYQSFFSFQQASSFLKKSCSAYFFGLENWCCLSFHAVVQCQLRKHKSPSTSSRSWSAVLRTKWSPLQNYLGTGMVIIKKKKIYLYISSYFIRYRYPILPMYWIERDSVANSEIFTIRVWTRTNRQTTSEISNFGSTTKSSNVKPLLSSGVQGWTCYVNRITRCFIKRDKWGHEGIITSFKEKKICWAWLSRKRDVKIRWFT
jgi:hypothetical protein